MRIALFTDSYRPTRDGVAVVVDGLARALTRRGHEVAIVCPQSTQGPAREVPDEGVRVLRVRSHPLPLYSEYRSPFVVSLARTLRRGGLGGWAEVVHLHTPGMIGTAGFFVARRSGRPTVGTYHTALGAMRESVAPKWGTGAFFRVAEWWSLGLYWRCDRTTAPTGLARDEIARRARKPFRPPIEVVPNGIDASRFSPGASGPDWRARTGLGAVPLVTYLGRLTIDKGIHRFLDAVAEVAKRREIAVLVGGRGPEESAVRARLANEESLARCARFVGGVEEGEKPALLAQSDLFVLPSTSDTSSVALLEAMACGIAVIGPAEGGPAEIVRDGWNGRRVPMREEGALRTAIEELLDDPTARRRLGEHGREFVQANASIDRMAARFEEVYRSLARAPR